MLGAFTLTISNLSLSPIISTAEVFKVLINSRIAFSLSASKYSATTSTIIS